MHTTSTSRTTLVAGVARALIVLMEEEHLEKTLPAKGRQTEQPKCAQGAISRFQEQASQGQRDFPLYYQLFVRAQFKHGRL